jgi:hypothetical protein
VLEVAAYGPGRHRHPPGDLLVLQPAGDQDQHLDLARRQPGGQGRPARHPVTGGVQHRVDRAGIEPARLGLGAQRGALPAEL